MVLPCVKRIPWPYGWNDGLGTDPLPSEVFLMLFTPIYFKYFRVSKLDGLLVLADAALLKSFTRSFIFSKTLLGISMDF